MMTKDSFSSLEGTGSPWCELLKEFIEISAFDVPGSPLVKKKEFSDCV